MSADEESITAPDCGNKGVSKKKKNLLGRSGSNVEKQLKIATPTYVVHVDKLLTALLGQFSIVCCLGQKRANQGNQKSASALLRFRRQRRRTILAAGTKGANLPRGVGSAFRVSDTEKNN